jgi:hypothetical protein
MPVAVILLLFAQIQECSGDAKALLTEASKLAAGLDAAAAAESLATAAALGCGEALVAQIYLGGLIAAQHAVSQGGSPESLRGVNAAIDTLERMSPRPVPADIARYVLMAAAAAAQSAREQMSLYLRQAVQIESLQLTARQPGVPMLTAHEAAGELWLRVYGYEEARQAYLDAFTAIGPTRRVLLGLARAEARLKLGPAACPDSQTTCQ